MNQAWKSILKSNPIFQHTYTLSAFCKHRTFRNHLVKGRYTSHNSDTLLDALITVLQQQSPH